MSLARANNSRFEGYFFCDECKWKGEHGNNRGICDYCERHGLKKLLRWKCVCCDKSTLWNGRSNHNRSKAHEKNSTIGPIRHRGSFISNSSIPLYQENQGKERLPFNDELDSFLDLNSQITTATTFSYPYLFNPNAIENMNNNDNNNIDIDTPTNNTTNSTNQMNILHDSINNINIDNLDNIEDIFCFISRDDDDDSSKRKEEENNESSSPTNVPPSSESDSTPSIGETLVLIDIRINLLEEELKELKKKRQDLRNQLCNPNLTTTTTTTTSTSFTPSVTNFSNTTPPSLVNLQCGFPSSSFLQRGSSFNSPSLFGSSPSSSPDISTFQYTSSSSSSSPSLDSPSLFESPPSNSPTLPFGTPKHNIDFDTPTSSPHIEFDPYEFDEPPNENETIEFDNKNSPSPIESESDKALPPIEFDKSLFPLEFDFGDETIDFDKFPFSIELERIIQFDNKTPLPVKSQRFLTAILSLTKLLNTILLPAIFAQQLMLVFAMFSRKTLKISFH